MRRRLTVCLRDLCPVLQKPSDVYNTCLRFSCQPLIYSGFTLSESNWSIWHFWVGVVYTIGMVVKRDYGGIIWTNHALDQLVERGLSQEKVWEAFNNPDSSSKGRTPDSFEFRKKFDKHTVTVITKKNEKNEWVVLSCWINPPLPGTEDTKQKEEYKKYQKSSGLGKVLLTVKKQLGF